MIIHAGQDAIVTVRPQEPGVYALSPYPFAAEGAEFAYAGRHLSTGQHERHGWPNALRRAPTVWKRFRLVAA